MKRDGTLGKEMHLQRYVDRLVNQRIYKHCDSYLPQTLFARERVATFIVILRNLNFTVTEKTPLHFTVRLWGQRASFVAVFPTVYTQRLYKRRIQGDSCVYDMTLTLPDLRPGEI